MSQYERFCNWLLGLSALSWAVLGLAGAAPDDRFTMVRLSVSGLNVAVGLLFIVRRPLVRDSSLRLILLCIPSLVVGGWAFNAAPPPHDWPAHAQAAFALAALWTAVSLVSLGRSFAIFPSVRQIVSHGPFRLIRHPAYAGELLLTCCCCLAEPSVTTLLPLLVAVPLVVVRIFAEEEILHWSVEYKAYTQRVPWRLLPYVW